jgi:tetratricopeptide (TPR) repeat protein
MPDLGDAAPPADAAALSDLDREAARTLVGRVNAQAALGPADVQAAEELYARHPGDSQTRNVLEAVLMGVARQERDRRRFVEAVVHLRRAGAVHSGSPRPRVALMAVLLETGDWAGAESAAREALALDGGDADALEGLGLALFRQDRDREAVDALEAALQVRNKAETRALVERIRRTMVDEKGMKDQHLSHFNVRYDGDAHDEVGREILRALERHYATLASTLDHQPGAAVPVILFSREAFYDASGAPAWSGGVYDNIDGRIRIPIGGLTASLSPDLDAVLIHEVTHAFVADRTLGRAPREIHEGLAQYMEGKRVASELDAEHLTALADGRIGGVPGFYLEALAFVEYLMGLRGQGGMNDLLRLIGEKGDVDDAFREVHGMDYRGAMKAWKARFRQQFGR